MVRRANRPDENYHRDKRRKGAKEIPLDVRNRPAAKRSLIGRLLDRLFRRA